MTTPTPTEADRELAALIHRQAVKANMTSTWFDDDEAAIVLATYRHELQFSQLECLRACREALDELELPYSRGIESVQDKRVNALRDKAKALLAKQNL